ncbi:MAG: EcsC family protein [Methylococcaceae bacterium]|nr:EcsC family protein [Methylococcaceae bacterium]
MHSLPQSLTKADQSRLIRAYEHLEYPSFAARLSSVVGTPIEMAMKLLPRTWYLNIQHCAEGCISKALDIAISNVRHKQGPRSDDRRYKMMGIATGAIGGFFGGPALLIELPMTTTVMLSSIANIARSQGEDLNSLETRMACMEVFALGGRSDSDDAAETGYYGLRMALELPIASASSFLAQQGLAARGNAPALVSLITTIAQRFGVVLSEKAVAEIIPIIGAAGGAFINSVFIQHFQDMAHSHFTMRRLERKYSPALIQAYYQRLKQNRATLVESKSTPINRRLPKAA